MTSRECNIFPDSSKVISKVGNKYALNYYSRIPSSFLGLGLSGLLRFERKRTRIRDSNPRSQAARLLRSAFNHK
jgi:hypothetical protein